MNKYIYRQSCKITETWIFYNSGIRSSFSCVVEYWLLKFGYALFGKEQMMAIMSDDSCKSKNLCSMLVFLC